MQREMQENTQILDSVAMADADIFDSIVEDAFAFACRLLRSVSRALQTEDGDEDLDLRQLQSVESPTQFLLTIEERMSDLNSSGKHTCQVEVTGSPHRSGSWYQPRCAVEQAFAPQSLEEAKAVQASSTCFVHLYTSADFACDTY
eukprot:TRINITY_DN42551_c0_g1_i5.p1 TRINITY_DN42551_c0_g1~~TRINITY_DN42551_c0_g1_i5.p1  ORF type:complete len:145 (-),score=14.15 TRINITY_DN42551_c0_g1_i5:448-882(-)